MVLVKIFLSALIVNNIVLVRILGVCPLFCLSPKSLYYWGISLTLNLIIATGLNWLIYHSLLLPFNLAYFRTLVFVLVIFLLTQPTRFLLKQPIIFTVNCAVLGIPLLAISYRYSLIQALIFALGSSLGFILVAMIFVALKERLELSPIPAPFQGIPIQLITLGLMALPFSGFVKFLR